MTITVLFQVIILFHVILPMPTKTGTLYTFIKL